MAAHRNRVAWFLACGLLVGGASAADSKPSSATGGKSAAQASAKQNSADKDDEAQPQPSTKHLDEDQAKVSTEDLRVDGPVGKMGPAASAAKSVAPPAKSAASKKTFEKLPPIDQPAPKPTAPVTAPTKPAEAAAKVEPKKVAEEPPLPELSKEMAATRERLRWVLAGYAHQAFSTQEHTPADIINLCMAYGCQTDVQHGGQALNGITCLCWNYPCSGYELIEAVGGRLAARIGYGYQARPGQLLAVLALSRVPLTYPVRSGTKIGTVADLVDYEKLHCRIAGDQSLRLIGLAHFIPLAETWEDSLGQKWSLEKLVKVELDRPWAESPYGSTQRLLGLSMAMHQIARTTSAADNATFKRTGKYVEEFQDYALKTQNADGSWHSAYFAAVGPSRDYVGSFRATAHIMQWLAFSLPAKRLDNTNVVRGVEYLVKFLTDQSNRWQLPAQSPDVLEAVACGLSALSFYDQRVFAPYDKVEEEKKKAEEEKKSNLEKPAPQARAEATETR